MSTHTAIATTSLGVIDAVQVPTEKPGPGEVLLKVAYASLMAFDIYVTDAGFFVQEYPATLGFNSSGTVVQVGAGVDDIKVGDRVAAAGFSGSREKATQEYNIQLRAQCAKIPDTLSLEAAATIPDNFVTGFYTLFNQLSLPVPESLPATTVPPLASTPILIYGAGSTAGQYAIQLLSLAGYKNIISTASKKHHEYLQSLGATSTFDYNSPSLIQDIAKAAGGDGKVPLAMDCITAEETLSIIGKVLSSQGTVAILLPVKEGNSVTAAPGGQMFTDIPEGKNPLPKGAKYVAVSTFMYQADKYLKENLLSKILPELLASGTIQPNRVRLLDQGTLKERVAAGLDLLRNNKVSGEKVIVKIGA